MSRAYVDPKKYYHQVLYSVGGVLSNVGGLSCVVYGSCDIKFTTIVYFAPKHKTL